MYGALVVRLFPNKRLNVDLKNIEIRVSHDHNFISYITFLIYCYNNLHQKTNSILN